MPWKNGTGSTDEICLLPTSASREQFDLRVSRATISVPGVFSSFLGVERTITLIEGAGLALEFADHTVVLGLGQPHTFDSGLTPVGAPTAGAVRVVNVMAARDVWQLAPANVLTEEMVLRPEPGGLNVVFALRGVSSLSDSEQTISLGQGDSALVNAAAHLTLAEGAAVLTVPLRPTTAV
ncbi:HutD family protein [Rhizobium sp. KVB221]|uniref:HutD family protein n=1 Tax=Rhizobium setariae TaxID=2801340 RepID=A0A936YVI5_9HYPH|nr:HutD family protein [Rhizobium setariae]MBL0373710.1 HutD family protein [Rhizobium setariae]